MFLQHTLHQFLHVIGKQHQDFVHRVYHKGSGKHTAAPHTMHIDNQEFALWELPEKLGFIKSVGSYKFEVTKKYLLLRDHIGWNGESNGARDFPFYPKYEDEFIVNVFLEPEQAQTFLDTYEWGTRPYSHSLKVLIELGWARLCDNITKHTEDNPVNIQLTDKGRRVCRYIHNTENFSASEDLEFIKRNKSHISLVNLACHPDLKSRDLYREFNAKTFEKRDLIFCGEGGDYKLTLRGKLVLHKLIESDPVLVKKFDEALEYEVKAAKEPKEQEPEEEIPTREHRCTIKETHRDGVELDAPVSWCGRNISKTDWAFQDAQHLARAVGGSVQPCKKCAAAVIKELSKEL